MVPELSAEPQAVQIDNGASRRDAEAPEQTVKFHKRPLIPLTTCCSVHWCERTSRRVSQESQETSVEFLRALGSQSGMRVWQHTLVG